MHHRKAVLLALVIELFILTGCGSQSSTSSATAKEGRKDLTRMQYENDIVNLDGEWEFYWNQLIEPAETDPALMTGYIAVPRSWNKYTANEGKNSGYGYASYRLIFMADENERLALKIPRLHTAYKLWVNGTLVAEAGTVGKNRAETTPQYLPQLAFFEAQQGNNEIVIHVSNFHHRSGGILENIKLGSEKQILGLRYKGIASNVLLFGCLIFIGAYHLALFFFRKKNDSALYFGLLCMLIGIRTLLVGECFFIYLFPEFSWEIAHKLMTLIFYLGTPLTLLFFMSVYPQYFHAPITKAAQLIGAASGLLILATPARVFTLINPVYQIWAIIVILYIFSTLIRIAINKEKDSWLIILGATAFILAALNDIIFISIWVNDQGPTIFKTLFTAGNLSPVGQLIFAFANSLLLAKSFSDSLEQEEIVTAMLTEVNTDLDKTVLERTEALIESKEKIEQQKCELEKANLQLKKLSFIDPLTGLWNRRKYDEIINLEWNRGLRYQRPIALILLDIDHFKKYNDCHGHLAGDDCLTQIGQTIQQTLTRATDLAVRYGGEEFIVILPEAQKEEAMKVAELLRKKIEMLHIPHKQSPASRYVTVSIGVAFTVPSFDSSHEALFAAADSALYRAKAEGRNKVMFLSE